MPFVTVPRDVLIEVARSPIICGIGFLVIATVPVKKLAIVFHPAADVLMPIVRIDPEVHRLY